MNKRPGLVKDPWQLSAASTEVRKPKLPPEVSPTVARHSDDIEKDLEKKKRATIDVKNYGGIVVGGTTDATEAAATLLRFCVDHAKYVEPILLNYGVILIQLTQTKLGTPFYIQRADGWTLAIPDVPTREQGCLQLIQAVNAMTKDSFLGPKLDIYQISAYIL